MSDSIVTSWTVACQAPLSMEFSRKEHWSGLPFPSLGNLPIPGIDPASPALQADSLTVVPPGKPLFVHRGLFLWGQLLDEMVTGWHHRLNGHEFEQTPGDSGGQGSLAC